MVLLKNNGLLPLDRTKLKHIAVIGPNANSTTMLYANYNGTASHPVTILEGIKALVGPGVEVTYERGCPLAPRKNGSNLMKPEVTDQVVAEAKGADVIIYVGGIDATLEKEEGNTPGTPFEGFNRGDRTQIELPSDQTKMLQKLAATGKPVVFVNCSGSAMAMPWAAKKLPAILQAWYPGEQGGTAVAAVLFGDVNPAGRLPVTFYQATADLPAFEDYSMSNRTYRYFSGKPLYAFGHGLSYTKFKYSKAKLAAGTVSAGDTIQLSFTVKNAGRRDGDEVAQVYFRHVNSAAPQPRMALCGFTRTHVAKGDDATVTISIPAARLRYWDTDKKDYVVEPGKYELLIGGASDDIRLKVPFKIAG